MPQCKRLSSRIQIIESGGFREISVYRIGFAIFSNRVLGK